MEFVPFKTIWLFLCVDYLVGLLCIWISNTRSLPSIKAARAYFNLIPGYGFYRVATSLLFLFKIDCRSMSLDKTYLRHKFIALAGKAVLISLIFMMVNSVVMIRHFGLSGDGVKMIENGYVDGVSLSKDYTYVYQSSALYTSSYVVMDWGVVGVKIDDRGIRYEFNIKKDSNGISVKLVNKSDIPTR